ncbi:hypothetical protein B0H21DRAFT_706088 [Amylocystis lapponica]|nr:hypothetical protein B0H21DRAFT_706088 [Amylocystis lapponica]
MLRKVVGLFMGIEVDYIAGTHVAWLFGCMVVIFSQKWMFAVLKVILKHTDVGLILYRDLAPSEIQDVPLLCTYDFVHFPGDYVKHKFGQRKSWTCVDLMVIGSESFSTQDLALAKGLVPQATLACNYACSEVGFAGISQPSVHPSDPVVDVISSGATQGCKTLMLLNDAMEIVPKTHIQLYTDDIGCVANDGCDVINGQRLRNVKIDGLFIDVDFVECMLSKTLGSDVPSHGVATYKLVNPKDDNVVMFWHGSSTNLDVLKRARETLRTHPWLGQACGGSRRCPTMQATMSILRSCRHSQMLMYSVLWTWNAILICGKTPRISEVALAITEEVDPLSNSIKPLSFLLQSQCDWDNMIHLFEDTSAEDLASETISECPDTISEAGINMLKLVDDIPVSELIEVSQDTAEDVMRLSRSPEPVSTGVPLMWPWSPESLKNPMPLLKIVAEQELPAVVVNAPKQPTEECLSYTKPANFPFLDMVIPCSAFEKVATLLPVDIGITVQVLDQKKGHHIGEVHHHHHDVQPAGARQLRFTNGPRSAQAACSPLIDCDKNEFETYGYYSF